ELRELFAGGVWFVSLALIKEAALVMLTIAQTLGIREGGGQSLFARVAAMLQPQPVLVFLRHYRG
ncbi:MAG TPA: hypothetical protein VKB53_06830, partial [Gammaproteobacteria bacterium]|nr:hypothetical protein [Gammaproteobacteria bacterium]